MRRRYPLHIHISSCFLTLILVVCVVLGGIGYRLSSGLLEKSATDLTARGQSRSAARNAADHRSGRGRDPSAQPAGRDHGNVTPAASRQPRLSAPGTRQLVGALCALRRLRQWRLLSARADWSWQRGRTVARAGGCAYVVQSIERAGAAPQGRLIYFDARLQRLREDDRPAYAADFDPRRRPWFQQGLASSTQVRTPPYLFYSSQKVGTTLARRSRKRPLGGRRGHPAGHPGRDAGKAEGDAGRRDGAGQFAGLRAGLR
jgi:hypothetical protein